MLSFWQHYEKLEKLYQNISGLIVFNHYEREMLDTEQIETWCLRQNRKVVYSPKAGFLASRFFNKKVPIFIHDDLKDASWAARMLQDWPVVTAEDIWNDPSGYCLNLSWKDIDLLNRLPSKGGVYIHAEGDPFSSREKEELKRKVTAAGFSYASYDDEAYYQHGYPANIKWFVDQVDPKVVIGYHGHHPERILADNGVNIVPELYKKYRLINDRLVKEDI